MLGLSNSSSHSLAQCDYIHAGPLRYYIFYHFLDFQNLNSYRVFLITQDILVVHLIEDEVAECLRLCTSHFSFHERVVWGSRPPCSIVVAGYACSHSFMVFIRLVNLLAVDFVVVGSLENT